jgi:hypothetical protein
MFEQLGWMAMAKKHNNALKISAYLDSINSLGECLERKLRETKDYDRKQDLQVLIENTNCLKNCAHHLLNSDTAHSDTDCKSGHSHEATFHGLHKWFKRKFEKLGWMCLAKTHGDTLKINAYMDSIERLKASLESKLNALHEADRKGDIKILHVNICVLQHAANKLLIEHNHTHTSYSKKSHNRTKKTHRNH